MENNSFFKKIRREGAGFLTAVSKADERAYLVLLALYIALYFFLKFGCVKRVEQAQDLIRYSLLSIVMWGSALYLFFVIASWKNLWNKNIPLIAAAAVILAGTWLFSRKMSTNSYGVVMDIFFCVMACGKDYRKMLRAIFAVAVIMIVLAGIGIPLGYTLDIPKPENVAPGHSLGIIYPNTWGYLVFLAMMICWYLYLRFRPVLTFLFFWSVSAFMYFYICCRTISLLGICFPVLASAVDLLEKRADRKAEEAEKTEVPEDTEVPEGQERKRFSFGKAAAYLVTAMPFFTFAFMMIMSAQYATLRKRYYHTWFRNLAMRFVQSGLYFKTYGLPLVGNPYRSNQISYVNVGGTFEKVGILDSSFASYIIMRGILWLMYTLAWLSAAIWKALKNRDYAIPFLEMIILIFALMERPGLELWYNFVLLYPLAKAACKTAKVQIKEETEVSES